MKSIALIGIAWCCSVGWPQIAAGQYRSPMPVVTLCAPGEVLQGGVCTPRPRGGPGTNPGAGTGWITGLPGREQTVCEWETGGYFLCPGNGKTNPRPK